MKKTLLLLVILSTVMSINTIYAVGIKCYFNKGVYHGDTDLGPTKTDKLKIFRTSHYNGWHIVDMKEAEKIALHFCRGIAKTHALTKYVFTYRYSQLVPFNKYYHYTYIPTPKHPNACKK